MQDRLDDPIQRTPTSQQLKQEIASGLWNFNIDESTLHYLSLNLEVYFRYYQQQADLFMHDAGRHVLVETHRDILKISKILNQNLDRNEVRERACSQIFPTKGTGQDKPLNASIILAVRLLLMVEVGDIPNGFSGYRPLQWDQGTLKKFMVDQFVPGATPLQERVRLEKIFTARNIERIAGIRLKWTDNFADHLRLFDSEDKGLVVNIFHHASFLLMQQQNDLFPSGLIEETLRTLALLFPRSDKEAAAWYEKIASKEDLDHNACRCNQLRAEDRQIGKFDFWRGRLVVLKQAFDEAEPNSWSQWWHDRRRGVHRYPLLVAAAALFLTLILGVVQCIEGGLQVYRASNLSNLPV